MDAGAGAQTAARYRAEGYNGVEGGVRVTCVPRVSHLLTFSVASLPPPTPPPSLQSPSEVMG